MRLEDDDRLERAIAQRDAAEREVTSMHAALNGAQVRLTNAQIEARNMRILVAWQASTLTEPQALQLLMLDRPRARAMLEDALAEVARLIREAGAYQCR
jgi:hypothetical protein